MWHSYVSYIHMWHEIVETRDRVPVDVYVDVYGILLFWKSLGNIVYLQTSVTSQMYVRIFLTKSIPYSWRWACCNWMTYLHKNVGTPNIVTVLLSFILFPCPKVHIFNVLEHFWDTMQHSTKQRYPRHRNTNKCGTLPKVYCWLWVKHILRRWRRSWFAVNLH